MALSLIKPSAQQAMSACDADSCPEYCGGFPHDHDLFFDDCRLRGFISNLILCFRSYHH